MSHRSIIGKIFVRILVATLILGSPSAVLAYGDVVAAAQDGNGFSGDASFAALKATLIEMLGAIDVEGCSQAAASALSQLPT